MRVENPKESSTELLIKSESLINKSESLINTGSPEELVSESRQLATLQRVPARPVKELGQATAEYALVILGAAAIAGVMLAWAVKSNSIEKLFDAVINEVIGKF